MFYTPVLTERHFERDLLYSHINWMHFPDAVDAFELRIRGWYIEPTMLLIHNSGHHSFTVMAMACMLIDTLSQYRYGELSSDGRYFKKFVNDHLPSYSVKMPESIWHFDHKFFSSGKELAGYAEVLWNGFRCGILHQAHAPLYCGVVPGTNPPKIEAVNHAKYATGTTPPVAGKDCPVVVISPEHLLAEVMRFFSEYLRNLKDRASEHDQLRADFKTKFADSFGIDLTNSTF